MKQKIVAILLVASLLLCTSFTVIASSSESASDGDGGSSIIDPNKETQIYWDPVPEGGYADYSTVSTETKPDYAPTSESSKWYCTSSQGTTWDASKALEVKCKVKGTWSSYVFTADDYDIDTLKATFMWGNHAESSEITEKDTTAEFQYITNPDDTTDTNTYLSGVIASATWISEDGTLGATIDYIAMGKGTQLYVDMKLYASDTASLDNLDIMLHLKPKADSKSAALVTKDSFIILSIDVDTSSGGNGSSQSIGDPHELTLNVVHGYCEIAETEDLTTYVTSSRLSDSAVPIRHHSGDQIESGKYLRIIPDSKFLGTLADGTSKLKSITILTANGDIVEYFEVARSGTILVEYAFVMPDDDVVVNVEFNAHEVSFSGTHCKAIFSTVRDNVNASDKYFFAGEQVTISNTVDPGYQFRSWEVLSGGVEVLNSSFTMGNSDVFLTAVVSEPHMITCGNVVGGTILFSKTTAFVGDTIAVTVTPNDGYEFKGLTTVPSVTFDNLSFVMPDSDIVVNAVFEPTKTLKTVSSVRDAFTVVDVTVVEGLGADLQNPTFLLVGKYDGDIVVNVYGRISDSSTHTERFELSTLGLNEVWVHLVDGHSAILTEYYAQIVVNG